jgi:hypothetical protein
LGTREVMNSVAVAARAIGSLERARAKTVSKCGGSYRFHLRGGAGISFTTL